MTDPVPAPLGVVAHYNLLERLDPSGPGELFRARDTHRGRTVTIRLLPPEFVVDDAGREALVAQARSLVPLSHPNITTLFDAGQQDGRVYLAFEHVKGQSLRAEMAGRPMNARRTLELTVQITDAVAGAHAAGFVHGGLSPQAVMVTVRGHAKIPTFHLASQVGFDPSFGETSLHDYDSPEEARGEPADDRSDIYSIGAVMYEMLTTRRPSHRGASAPSATNPRVPKELDAIVLKAIHPRPQLRYQSAAALAADLRATIAVLDTREGMADDDVPASDDRRSSAVPILIAAGLIGAAAAVWWFTRP